ncbi:hypothetical protein LAZ67_3006186 [Cordylochernes scorpioides]|uniref:Uncharacterized protein n=1 Tax=Cordylochernes scorpioides TaxID=51811 RepID=A0ABY6KE04_9ARAC|nr:hypothetical protein LAZ67_3006186 [Cordylochernes scorpioides]
MHKNKAVRQRKQQYKQKKKKERERGKQEKITQKSSSKKIHFASTDNITFEIQQETIDIVDHLIGSNIGKMGGCLEEVNRRIALGRDTMINVEKATQSANDRYKRTTISILNEINPVRSLESQICKQRLNYFGHIMRANGLEKMLGNIEGRLAVSWLEGVRKVTR